MPDLDGPAMFDAIRETRPELVSRIAFITGDTMSGRIRTFLQGSERPYIEKPITPQDVRDLVHQMLRFVFSFFHQLYLGSRLIYGAGSMASLTNAAPQPA